MKNTRNKFYVTTPIFYANDKPHIGHAYTTIMADVFARFHRKIKGPKNVFFLTGTDEHGSKIEKSAKAQNLPPQNFVDAVSEEYKKVWEKLNISYDEFFRTTDTRHKAIVQNFLQKLYDRGFIYKAKYKGLYCVGCEKFLSFDEMTSNNTCVYHPNVILTEQEEENYFFKLKEFSDLVLNELNEKKFEILPTERKNEILSKIKNGIEDISISRSGVSWGIKLPWDKSHTVYVWVDALLNYYSATKIYEDKDRFWPPSLHLMAKDILWFHSLIWEALLLANDLDLPNTVFAHGFFTVNGQKMSKTLGNVINPIDLADNYGSDAARYLLISSFSFGNDGNISLEKFNEKYNSDLANGIGNLVSRIAKLCENSNFKNTNLPIQNFSPEIVKYMDQYRPDEAIKSIWKRLADFDRIIGEDKPWKLDGEKLTDKLEVYIKTILQVAYDLEPFLPETSEIIRKIFIQDNIKKPNSIFMRK